MLSTDLDDQFRALLQGKGREYDPESLKFAIDFARLLIRILPDVRVGSVARTAILGSLSARSALAEEDLLSLLDLAVLPEHRQAIGEDELRAFGARFGGGEEQALRAAVGEELDLAGFAERYGPSEALLLLDALFTVCAVDGVIDRQEIGRLTNAARELSIDQMLVGALFRKHDVRHAKGDFTFTLERDRYVIGRGNSCDVTLPDPQVALRHAELVRGPQGWRIQDLSSGRPTLVNGSPVSSAPLRPGDQLRVGSFSLSLDAKGQILTVFGQGAFSALSVRKITRKIGQVSLLDDVNFTVFSGEVIAVVGPSGAGKTTMLNAIAGIAPADKGDVLLDGQDFHALLAANRSIVGNVPQDDVVHPELTVEESLYYSGRLRFPPDVGREAIQAEVDRVLKELGIEHIRNNRIGDAVKRGISGGQRKRVNLGQELLTRSTKVLFLDEPTSGLDPQTAQDIVSLIRQLADDGRIVFLVTHDVTPSVLSMVDHLMVLAPGGRLAWFGPPEEAKAWFGVRSVDEIFARLPDAPPTEWGKKYKESTAFRKFVKTREQVLGLDSLQIGSKKRATRSRRSQSNQFSTLTRRFWRVKLRDRSGMAVLALQAPILGVAMWVVFPQPEPGTMFMLALSCLWFGASSSVRELISDRTIWRRESRVGLRTIPYLLSKITVLGTLVGLQCSFLAGMVWLFMLQGSYEQNIDGVETMVKLSYNPVLLAFVASMTGWVGMGMGLLMSAMFASSEAAVGTLPLLLIPQITFGGLLVKVKDMGILAKALSWLTIVRYSFDAAIKTGYKLPERGKYPGSWDVRDIGGVLHNLGFRTTSDAEDVGVPLFALILILGGFFSVFTFWTLILTRRAKDGN